MVTDREFKREGVKKRVARLKNRKAAGAGQIVSEFKCGGGKMLTTMVSKHRRENVLYAFER